MSARNAILKAKIEGVISELMVKTDAANVYVDDNTTLAAKLTSIIADIATRASTTELTNGLATKAAASHTHAQSEVTGLTEALAALASSESVTAAIDALRQEMLGDTPVEAYNTFTELAAYIEAHQEVSDALSAAIGTKADKATTLAGYGIDDAYTKAETDDAIIKGLPKAVFNIHVATVDPVTEEPVTPTTRESPGETYTAYDVDGKMVVVVLDSLHMRTTAVSVRNGVVAVTAFAPIETGLLVVDLAGEVNDETFSRIDITFRPFSVLTINGYDYSPLRGETESDQDFTDVINGMIDAKISSATGGESAASVKAALDTYKTSNNARVDALEGASHTHANKTVLDGIAASNVSAWNAKSDSNIYYSAIEPSNLTNKDLWVQLV